MTNSDPYEALKKLAELKDQGVLTEEEFTSQKTKILRSLAPPDPAPAVETNRQATEPPPSPRAYVPPREEPGAIPGEPRYVPPIDYPIWNELLRSQDIAVVLKSNVEPYRQKFERIVEKSGAGDKAISDAVSLGKVTAVRSWNWAGFLLGPFWAAYRGIYLWPFIVAAACAIAIAENYFGPQSGLTVLKNDKRAIFTAAAYAQKAADFLNGLQGTNAEGERIAA